MPNYRSENNSRPHSHFGSVIAFYKRGPGLPEIFNRLTTRTLLLTAATMLAFAANSLLCRLALGPKLIDATSFTSVRVISGAVTLGVIMLLRQPSALGRRSADWRAVVSLFTYMVFFSFAYLSLGAGTGALILFGAVQLTMFTFALRGGEHFTLLSWAGLTMAIAGLIYLVSPGVTAPDPLGAILMAIAGMAWGFIRLSAGRPKIHWRLRPEISFTRFLLP